MAVKTNPCSPVLRLLQCLGVVRHNLPAGDVMPGPANELAAVAGRGWYQGLRTIFSQLFCLFLNISKPRSASSSGRVWVMIRVGSISPRSMRCSSGLM